MRQTKLNRTSLAAGAAILVILAGVSYLRSTTGGDPAESRGSVLFREKGCIRCHHVDRADEKMGHGPKGVLDAGTLPASGRPATRENIRKQLFDPYDSMPSYAGRLNDEETEAIIDYLKRF